MIGCLDCCMSASPERDLSRFPPHPSYELIQAVVRGRLRLTLEVEDWLEYATRGAKIDVIPIGMRTAEIAARLPLVHGDPLDRLIIATALEHGGQLVSLDGKFSGYPELSKVLIAR